MCEAGFKLDGDCVLCSQGEYQSNEVNVASCTPCPDRKTTEFTGSTMESECSKNLDLYPLTKHLILIAFLSGLVENVSHKEETTCRFL